MKKLLIFLFCSFMSASFALSPQSEKKTVISGTVHNPKATHIRIENRAVSLDSQGGFQYAFDLKKAAYVEVDYGRRITLYLKPGESIALEVDPYREINSIEMRGDSAEINRFVVQEAYESSRIIDYLNADFEDIAERDEEAHMKKLREMWQPRKERLDEFVDAYQINDDYFIKTRQAVILYAETDCLIRYADRQRQISGEASYRPSDKFYAYLDRLDLNDPELLEIEEYKTFLIRYLDFVSNLLRGDDAAHFAGLNYKSYRAKMRTALSTFSDPVVRTEMLYSFMPRFISEYYHKGIEDLIATFRQNCTNRSYIAEIEGMLNRDKSVRDECRIEVYKTIDGVTLDAFVYLPSGAGGSGLERPALAFFHGGGWESGKPEWGFVQCRHFSSLGMVAISFEYRLLTQHDATPLESISDAKSSIRWMRQNASRLGIDPDRIVASGFSAGGHLAACTSMIERWDDPHEDRSISSAPNALFLWAAAVKLSEGGRFERILRGRASVKGCDPDSHIRPGLPPAIMFHGRSDEAVPLGSAIEFARKMNAAGNRCDLHVYERQAHFNWAENARDVFLKMNAFLRSLGFLD